MPFNLLKTYNSLLEIDNLNPRERIKSLRGVFRRDIEDNEQLSFMNRKIKPTKNDADGIALLFNHLTTETVDYITKRREFEHNRAKRLHWIKFHLEFSDKSKLVVFSVSEKGNIRTYIYDEAEDYVIILEPFRNQQDYYFITAYYLEQKKDKIKKKMKRMLPIVY